MREGFFIVRGDKTTCGGVVLDGDARINMFGMLHTREGDRVTCGKDGKIYKISGGVGFIESHGKLVAGTLDSWSMCPCKARLIASQHGARYYHEDEAAPAPRAFTQPPLPTESSRLAAEQQSAFTPSNAPAAPAAFSGVEPQEPGFYVVPKSISREALEATLFPQPDPAVMRKFRALNPGAGEVKAGSMIVLSDPRNTSCMYQEALMMQAAVQVNEALEPLTPDEADFLFRHAAEIAAFTGQTSTWLGVTAAVLEKHLSNLRDTLQAIERLHQDSYRQHGHLKSPQFFAQRKLLLAQLDAHLLNSTRLRGYTSLGDHLKLKTALGISSKSLVHNWNQAGAPGQIPGYATHIKAFSRAAAYMAMGGYIGIAIGGVSTVIAVQEVCRDDPGAACKRIKFTEGGKFTGATAGAAVGGWASGIVAAPLCIAIGIPTATLGTVICAGVIVGAGAGAGAVVGGQRGEAFGEVLYQTSQP